MDLRSALARMDVVEFKPAEVYVLRAALSALQDDINPPKDAAESALLERVLSLDQMFEKWQENSVCSECGSSEHKHYLSCSALGFSSGQKK